jgi:UDP-N-acetylmuramoyl-tripeptide--D-alanyl-D-alanine ligase
VDSEEHSQRVQLNLPGLHSVNNALAAAACATAAGATIDQVVTGLETLQSVAGRLQYHYLSDRLTVIDDSYNANPDSFKMAVDVLSRVPGHKILVMGDMGELGKHAQQMHSEVGRYIDQSEINNLYTVGANSAYANEMAKGQHFANQQRLITALEQQLKQLKSTKTNVTILIKGSRGAAMEVVVNHILSLGDLSC